MSKPLNTMQVKQQPESLQF